MNRHENSGHCLKCQDILNAYPNFNPELRTWFEALQLTRPEAHISCAGRGHIEQEAAVHRGASRAHFGQSAHNYNAALDLFVLLPGELTIYPVSWFLNVLQPILPAWIEWYGHAEYKTDKAKFYELPHIQLKDWIEMRRRGELVLVEIIEAQKRI